MTLRDDLRGVRRVDLASAVLIVPTLIFGLAIAQDAGETQVPVQETQVQETQVPEDEYKAVWDWCGIRFPYREDLQEACKWGAYKMLPGQEVPADEGVQDA
jgi:hypothetical protein